jgi:peptidoglycan/xylan/chitin deacetylase (PgdA/CDA1 family)
MWISPETFSQQIRWMRSIGEIVDYRRILDIDTPNDRPLFCLTFDDGWRDNYHFAFPILQDAGVPALIFLATDAINSGELFWTEDVLVKTKRALESCGPEEVVGALNALVSDERSGTANNRTEVMSEAESCVEAMKWVSMSERKQRLSEYFRRIHAEEVPLQGEILNWDEVRTMHRAGIDFGSHTHTHRILTMATHDEMELELAKSKAIISEQLQADVPTFCYPNASYRGDEGPALARYGYRFAFRIDDLSLKHYDDPFYVPRIMVYEEITRNPSYLKLRLLEIPFYRGG